MDKNKTNLYIPILSGGIAGGLETIVIWPTEYTKTLLQLQINNQTPKYKGMIDCATQQINKYGAVGLYRGMVPALGFAIPKAGIKFGSFSFFHNLIIKNTNNEKTPIKNLTAGMMAGVTEAILVVTPQETIKTKLIEMNNGFYNGIKIILKNEGVLGIYTGLMPTILKQSTNQGLRFMSYGIYKNAITNINGNQQITTYQSFIGGMIGGTISTLCNNPIDVVKTRMQGLNSHQYNNTLNCIRIIIKKEGVYAFYNGIIPRLMRVIPGQGIIFASYEKISHILHKLL
jgi:solute carrier family 25 (mitochondrial citrate transporter), member 1